MEPSQSPGPRNLDQLRSALAQGQRRFAELRLRDLDGVDLDLSGCDLRGSCFKEARFGRARFRAARLEGCCFQQALLWGADLSEAAAPRSFWHEADLSGSRLQQGDFCGAVMHRCCLRGVVAAGSRWQQARLVEADFRSGLDQLTDLGRADFRGADLSFALLQGAQLHGADLRDTCLYGTDLRHADLREADLRGCDLRDCQLDGTRLDGARLEGARWPDEP